MFRPTKITFHLDGSGVYYDPFEPPMLDGILAVAFMSLVRARRGEVYEHEEIGRDEPPYDVPLPLARWSVGDVWGWKASALFPDGETAESLVYWRKRLRQHRIELTEGSPNTTNGVYRDWNMPLPLLLCRRMVAYCVTDREGRRDIRRQLEKIRWIGKKRAHGRGRVIGVTVEQCEVDYSIARDGTLTRWMPSDTGSRLVRPRPPYWNVVGRVRCAEIGETATDVAVHHAEL